MFRMSCLVNVYFWLSTAYYRVAKKKKTAFSTCHPWKPLDLILFEAMLLVMSSYPTKIYGHKPLLVSYIFLKLIGGYDYVFGCDICALTIRLNLDHGYWKTFNKKTFMFSCIWLPCVTTYQIVYFLVFVNCLLLIMTES